jgi:hypothetical protein
MSRIKLFNESTTRSLMWPTTVVWIPDVFCTSVKTASHAVRIVLNKRQQTESEKKYP